VEARWASPWSTVDRRYVPPPIRGLAKGSDPCGSGVEPTHRRIANFVQGAQICRQPGPCGKSLLGHGLDRARGPRRCRSQRNAVTTWARSLQASSGSVRRSRGRRSTAGDDIGETNVTGRVRERSSSARRSAPTGWPLRPLSTQRGRRTTCACVHANASAARVQRHRNADDRIRRSSSNLVVERPLRAIRVTSLSTFLSICCPRTLESPAFKPDLTCRHAEPYPRVGVRVPPPASPI
jgi:hypothetical protein